MFNLFGVKKKKHNLLASFFGLLMAAFTLNSNAALIDVDFFIDGNTFNYPFTLENNSSGGLEVISFALDLRPNASQYLCFDESIRDCHPSGGLTFRPITGAGDDVGYLSYSIIDAVGGIDSFDFLTVFFDGFSSGESFSWMVDIDDNPDGSVYGNDLIGSIFLVEMSDGKTYQGILEEVLGNSDASQLRIVGESDTSIQDSAANAIPEPKLVFIFGLLIVAICSRKRNVLNSVTKYH